MSNFSKLIHGREIFLIVCVLLLFQETWLQWVFEKLVILMVMYFVVSIVNSLAQNYHKRLYRRTQAQKAPVYRGSSAPNLELNINESVEQDQGLLFVANKTE